MRVATLVLVLLLSCIPCVAAAQLDPRVRAGARVRVDWSQDRVQGKVIAVADDTIVVERAPGDLLLAIPLRDATALSVYGRSEDAQAFSTILGILGAASGVALYLDRCTADAAAWCTELEKDDDPYDDEEPQPLIVSMTLGFGMLGALLGYALAPPKWHRVGLPVRTGIAPMKNGAALYVSLPAPRFLRF